MPKDERSELVDESTPLGRMKIFAAETNDYTIRAAQIRPEIRALLASLEPQAGMVRLSDDECAICGKTRKQHSTVSGYGVCQIYPMFVSKRAMVERLTPSEQGSGLREALESVREPTDAMIKAAAATPGMKAVNDAMVLYQVRGYRFDEEAFKDGSPLQQAWRAMIAFLAAGA